MSTQLTVTSKPPMMGLICHELGRDPHLKSAKTTAGYAHDLETFERWRAGRTLTKLLVEEYARHLQQEGKAPRSINRALSAVRWWAHRIGELSFEDMNTTKEERDETLLQVGRILDVHGVRGERAQAGRHVEKGEMYAIIQACLADDKNKRAGVRDAALITVGIATGVRRSELAGIKLADITWTGDDEAEIVICGKGDKQRKVYLGDKAVARLKSWLAIRGQDAGALFCPVNKSGKIRYGYGMTDKALELILHKRMKQAGLKPLNWHDFRRTLAGNLLDLGEDLVTVQKLLGHSSPTTTSRYDRRGERTVKRAAQRVEVP